MIQILHLPREGQSFLPNASLTLACEETSNRYTSIENERIIGSWGTGVGRNITESVDFMCFRTSSLRQYFPYGA